ncbi:restriction endonuclease subunit S [Corallibacter sp.]|uniref:restriction endonuclease subunit S n=1 Tax=Corallibacter sp. TaxID=2038084 RepID=UPI003AB6EA5D
MREGWSEVRLIEVTSKIGSGVTPRGGSSVYVEKGIPIFRSQNIYNGEFSTSGLAYINDTIASKMKNVEVVEDDVLLNITGDSVARCCIPPREFIPGRVNQHVSIIRPRKAKLNPRYLMYSLISPRMQATLLAFASGAGATRNALTKSVLENTKINLPPLKTQRKIASILSAYDDLIENNLKRIKLLEEQAQLTYEEWFVRFKFPGHETTNFDEDTGLPEGWEKVKASEKIKLISGYAFKGKEFTDVPNNHIAIRMGNFKVGGGLKTEKSKYLVDHTSVRKKFHLKHNDLVMVLSDVTREGLLIGNVGLVPNNGNNYYLNQRVSKVQLEEDFKMYAYAVFNSNSFKHNCISKANSVTVLNLKNDDVYGYKMTIPTKNIINKWNEIYGSSIKLIQNFELQNQHLKEARDILLPRLMSGVIDPSTSSGQVVEKLEINDSSSKQMV